MKKRDTQVQYSYVVQNVEEVQEAPTGWRAKVGVLASILGLVLVLVSVVFFALIGLTQKASFMGIAESESITVKTLVEQLIDAFKNAEDGSSDMFFSVIVPNSLTLAFYGISAIVMLVLVIKALISHIAYFKTKTNGYSADKSALAVFVLYVTTAFVFKAGWAADSEAMGASIVCDFNSATVIGLVVCSGVFFLYLVVRTLACKHQSGKSKTLINVIFNIVMIACSYVIMTLATSALLGYSISDIGDNKFGFFGWYSSTNTGNFKIDGKSIQDLGQLLTGLMLAFAVVFLEGNNIKGFALELNWKSDMLMTKGKRRQIAANPYVSLLLSVVLVGFSLFVSYRMIKDDADSSLALTLPILVVVASLVNVILYVIKKALTKDKKPQ